MKIKELLTSRKFWAAVGAVGLVVGQWVSGEISSQVAVPSIVAAVSVWLNSQSRVDAANVSSANPSVREG